MRTPLTTGYSPAWWADLSKSVDSSISLERKTKPSLPVTKTSTERILHVGAGVTGKANLWRKSGFAGTRVRN
jgi:hypothetical protein